MASNILVLGAGELGTSILKALVKRAPPTTKISVLLRPATITSSDAAKIDELKVLSGLNIAFVPGDSSQSVSELADIFRPYDLVISSLGFVSGPGLQIKITKAAFEAKVKRYVPWQFGVDYDVVGRGSVQPVWDEQLDVRDLLRGQKDVEWLIVSTGIFMSFLFEPWFGVVDLEAEGEEEGDGKGVVRALGSWGNEVTVTTPADIGLLTAEILFDEKENLWNQVVFVAGETVSYSRVAWAVDNALGRGLRREVWTVEGLKEELKKDPEDLVKRYRVAFAEGRGVAWEMGRTWNKKRGVKVTDIEAFVKEKYGNVAKE